MRRILSTAALLCTLLFASFSPPADACPTSTDSIVVADSLPRFDTNAIEWQIAPIGVTQADSFYHYAAVSGVAVAIADTAGDHLLRFKVLRKFHDQQTVYRLVGRDAEGRRHDVTVPYKVWILAPSNRELTLPVNRPSPEQ